VSALDVSIQSQVLNLLDDLQKEFGLTYLFIAHNLAVVEHISDRVGVMYLGKLVELADVDTIYANPRHPYTVALLSAIPNPDPKIRKRRLVLKGDIPSPANPPSGCRSEEPVFRDLGTGHLVACHYSEEMDTVGAEVRAAVGIKAREPGASAVPSVHEAAPVPVVGEADLAVPRTPVPPTGPQRDTPAPPEP
jgi:oligopeptide/dipeptide ABC transporter ATP-binding protein